MIARQLCLEVMFAVDSITGQHWLYDWIDEYEISSPSLVPDRWRTSAAQSRLVDLVVKARGFSAERLPDRGIAVAGIGLDVGSRATCSQYACISRVLDSEFPQILHYFDSVVMEGPSADLYAQALLAVKSRSDEEDIVSALENHVAIMQHIRRIGLADYTIFEPNVNCLCDQHVREYAQRLGVEHLLDDDSLLQVAKDLSRDGKVHITQNSAREWFGSLRTSQFAGSVGARFRRKTRPKKYDVARYIIRRQLFEMMFDAVTAEQLAAPLASLGEPDFFSVRTPSRLNVDDIALRVKIPVLEGMSTEGFIKLRENDDIYYQRFRLLLQEAIEETMNETSAESPDLAAEIVWNRKIYPQWLDLKERISSSKSTLIGNLAAGVVAGAASVGIGPLVGALAGTAGMSIAAAIGSTLGTVGVAAASRQVVADHLKERQQFKYDKTYFLWKAAKASDHV